MEDPINVATAVRAPRPSSVLDLMNSALWGMELCTRMIEIERDPRSSKKSVKLARQEAAPRLVAIIEQFQAYDVAKVAQAQVERSSDHDVSGEASHLTFGWIGDVVNLSDVDLVRLREDLAQEVAYAGHRILQESRWVPTFDGDTQRLIGVVANALKALLNLVRSNNELSDGPPIDQLERDQLIALLEAALAELKAPYVDVGRWTTVVRSIRRMFGKAVENVGSKALEDGFRDAIEAGEKLSEHLSEVPSFADIPFL